MATIYAGKPDLVAYWDVLLPEGKFHIEFEHGTVTGRRLLRVNGEEKIKRDWMFKLVGNEVFTLGKNDINCLIKIEPYGGFSYQYSLEVKGKTYKTFTEQQAKILKTWTVTISGVKHRVVLEKDTLDVWVDSSKVETAGEFFDGGAETHFTIDNQPAHIKAVSSGNRHKGLIHTLFLENEEVPSSVANHFNE